MNNKFPFLSGRYALVMGFLIGVALVYAAIRMTDETDKTAAKLPPTTKQPRIAANNQKITGYVLPDAIDFAGEHVPIDRPEIAEKLDREIQVNAFWHSNSILMIKRSAKWLPTIDSILAANDIPSDFKYLAVAESGLQNVISPKNAVGFWQLLRGTAGDMGLTVNNEIDERYDPFKSTVAATKYLKQAYAKFQNWTLAAAAYNMGMSATAKVLENQKSSTYYEMILSEEPSRYIFRILAIKALLEHPGKYGFQVAEKEKYQLPKWRTVVIDQTTDWHDFAAQNLTTYYQLRQLNPWIRSDKIAVNNGQVYQIKIPIN